MPDVRRQLVVHGIADRADNEHGNVACAADLGHGERFHIHGECLVLDAKLPLLFAEAHDTIQRDQPPTMHVLRFAQPRCDRGRSERDFVAIGIDKRIGGNQIVPLDARVQTAGKA